MVANPRKRLEIIEKQVLPSLFVGILSKDDKWLEHTMNVYLPELEAKALRLAQICREEKLSPEDESLCDPKRIKALFKETREKLMEEHVKRESLSRFN